MTVGRTTRQRKAIRSALQRAGRPLSAGEVHAAAREAVPGLGIATVYRNLRALAQEGWLLEVEIPGPGPMRYEVAGKGHHHHFHCRLCDRVFEVDDCPGGVVALTPDGFRTESHDVILYGLCAACRRQEDGPSSPRARG